MHRAIRILAMFAALALASCKFNPEQQAYVDRTLALQAPALTDARFADILRELDSRGEIVWASRLSQTAEDEAAGFPSRLDWMLAKYAQNGGLPPERLKAWIKWYWPPSRTTAQYDSKTGLVRLNLLRFNKDDAALLNTFVHEQNHSFGLIHVGQTRPANACDPGYLAGDLAEALSRSGSPQTGGSPHGPVCEALCYALQRRGLWSHPGCPRP